MSDNKLPAFRLYTADFVMGTITMTAEQTGAYIILLCYQWDKGYVPWREAAKIGRCSTAIAAQLLRSKFPVGTDGRRRNKRLERERLKAHEYSQKQKAAGTKGAETRWKKEKTAMPSPMAPPSARQSEPTAKTCLPLSVSVSVSNKEKERSVFVLKTKLSQAFNRKEADAWPYNEDCQLLDLERRTNAVAELDEILAYRLVAGKFFPSSIARLLDQWTHVLDRARNQSTTEPAKASKANRDADRMLRAAENL